VKFKKPKISSRSFRTLGEIRRTVKKIEGKKEKKK